MGTRCYIGKKIGNQVKYLFCHYDGYVDNKVGVGYTLNKYYTNEESVDELFSLGGYIDSLKETPRKTALDLKKKLKEYPNFNDYIKDKQIQTKPFYSYLRSCVGDIEWVYLYDDGEWFYTMYNMRGFHSLKDSLNDWGHYVVYRDKDEQYFCSGDEEAAWDYFLNFEKLNKECLQLVDARTGKQIAADHMWREKYGDEELEERYSRRGRMLKEARNKIWNTVSLDQVHSRDLEDMIVDFGMRQKFLKDLMDYAVHSDSYDDKMENWSRDDVLNHFCDSDPYGYAKAVRDLAKRYWNNGELPKDEVRDWCLEQGFVLGESSRRPSRMLKESYGFDWEHGNFDVYDLIKFLEKRTGIAFKKYNTTTDQNNEGAFERFFETTVPDVGDVTIIRYEDENDSVLEVYVDGEYVDGIDPTGDEDADPHFEEERNEFLERLVNLLQGKTF